MFREPLAAGIELLPFRSQEFGGLRDKSFGASDVAIGDRADDLNRAKGRQIDLHDGTSLRDMHVRRRMIEGVDSDLEAGLAYQRGHYG